MRGLPIAMGLRKGSRRDQSRKEQGLPAIGGSWESGREDVLCRSIDWKRFGCGGGRCPVGDVGNGSKGACWRWASLELTSTLLQSIVHQLSSNRVRNGHFKLEREATIRAQSTRKQFRTVRSLTAFEISFKLITIGYIVDC